MSGWDWGSGMDEWSVADMTICLAFSEHRKASLKSL